MPERLPDLGDRGHENKVEKQLQPANRLLDAVVRPQANRTYGYVMHGGVIARLVKSFMQNSRPGFGGRSGLCSPANLLAADYETPGQGKGDNREITTWC